MGSWRKRTTTNASQSKCWWIGWNSSAAAWKCQPGRNKEPSHLNGVSLMKRSWCISSRSTYSNWNRKNSGSASNGRSTNLTIFVGRWPICKDESSSLSKKGQFYMNSFDWGRECQHNKTPQRTQSNLIKNCRKWSTDLTVKLPSVLNWSKTTMPSCKGFVDSLRLYRKPGERRKKCLWQAKDVF